MEIIAAVACAALLWWFLTGVIFYLDGLPKRTYFWSLAAATLIATCSLIGLMVASRSASVGSAYAAFGFTLLIWGWQEMLFLMGGRSITTKLPAQRFRAATLYACHPCGHLSRTRAARRRRAATGLHLGGGQSCRGLYLPRAVDHAALSEVKSLLRRAQHLLTFSAAAHGLSRHLLSSTQLDWEIFHCERCDGCHMCCDHLGGGGAGESIAVRNHWHGASSHTADVSCSGAPLSDRTTLSRGAVVARVGASR